MKRTRKERGITLVALIITIIVLLILAVVSIRAVQGDGIIEYAKNAKSEYQIAQENEATLLQEYMGYLNNEISPSGGNAWITIYEGNATTDEGEALLGETDLFAYGANVLTYRITVESEEYTGKIETVPISAGTEDGMTGYYLFAVENGEAIGFTSLKNSEEKLSNLGENASLILGVSQEGMCGLMLINATNEYTITKIERKEISGKKIFEGAIELKSGFATTEILNLKETINPARKYMLVFTVNGTQINAESYSSPVIGKGKIEIGVRFVYPEGITLCENYYMYLRFKQCGIK